MTPAILFTVFLYTALFLPFGQAFSCSSTPSFPSNSATSTYSVGSSSYTTIASISCPFGAMMPIAHLQSTDNHAFYYKITMNGNVAVSDSTSGTCHLFQLTSSATIPAFVFLGGSSVTVALQIQCTSGFLGFSQTCSGSKVVMMACLPGTSSSDALGQNYFLPSFPSDGSYFVSPPNSVNVMDIITCSNGNNVMDSGSNIPAGYHCGVITKCSSTSCSNGGTCSVINNAISCSCINGWSGSTCTINVCANVVCQNGGSCSSSNGQCQCINGYSGSNCQTAPCANIVCQNGGICRSGTCNCRLGFSGSLCQTVSFIPTYIPIYSVTNFCIDVPGAVSTCVYPLVMSSCNGVQSQNWAFSNGQFINQNSGLCMDIYGGGKTSGTNVGQFPCAVPGNNNQNWVLNSDLSISSPSAPWKCLAINGNSLEIISCISNPSQLWTTTVSEESSSGAMSSSASIAVGSVGACVGLALIIGVLYYLKYHHSSRKSPSIDLSTKNNYRYPTELEFGVGLSSNHERQHALSTTMNPAAV